MHQPRLLALGVAHHFQHLIDVPRGAGTALHGETGGLVQYHDIGVLKKDHVLERGKRLRPCFRKVSRRFRRIEF